MGTLQGGVYQKSSTRTTKMSTTPDGKTVNCNENELHNPNEQDIKEMKEQNLASDAPSDSILEKLRVSFEGCIRDDGKILIKNYIDGFEELYKFLNLLGTVFGWVSTDVDAKMEVLRQHRKAENADKYENVQDMVAYEVDNKLIKPKARDSSTGSRNLLRLHRALEYIIAFLKGVPDLGTDEKCCPLSQDAYKRTLMKHHPWVVQKAATLAMHMLPLKKGLLEKVSGKEFGSDEYKAAEEILPRGVKVMEEVYAKTEEIYKQHDLLTLP